MRILVLGGTVFCSRAVAEAAVARGHDVTCACRGESGALPDGVRHVRLDRSTTDAASVLDDTYDAVVDVARDPAWVRSSVAATPSAHHVLVSTINVYPDTTTPGGGPATLALHEPLHDVPAERAAESDVYGALKVGCERATEAVASRWVVRPGLIVGPGDTSHRYPWWVRRLVSADRGEEVVAPGAPDDAVQVVDVRDLAAWLVDGAERRLTGVHDGVGPVLGRGALLDAIARGVGADVRWRWVDQDTLLAHGVAPWAGPRSLPLWLPLPEHAGLMAHDPGPARAAGLAVRAPEDTAADTAAWLATRPDPPPGEGLTRDEEQDLLRAVS
ncbi:NAD-dependent epimerase/dehydratase family protein [Nocardioides sp. CFH 31398]|uniref:NAD-dependent epimerase/dehydratase family protein n=1 Tax=Nocardioides sp. CFH 31398 TaxID=2919579 RepID=UPI001F06BEAE|nr:NAD-dependent epimerase/dehydratase family protein [Nocardioides sp. CFH 31398]MCH1864930.1 epimerase [Nocardioides sp. CFH 31398]